MLLHRYGWLWPRRHEEHARLRDEQPGHQGSPVSAHSYPRAAPGRVFEECLVSPTMDGGSQEAEGVKARDRVRRGANAQPFDSFVGDTQLGRCALPRGMAERSRRDRTEELRPTGQVRPTSPLRPYEDHSRRQEASRDDQHRAVHDRRPAGLAAKRPTGSLTG